MSTDYKTDYSHDKNINTLDRGSYGDFGDGTPGKQIIGDTDKLLEAIVVKDPLLTTVAISTAGDKKSHTFRDGTKRLIITTGEKNGGISYNWDESKYDGGDTHHVDEGSYYEIVGTDLVNKTLYFTSDTDNIIIEIEEWI